MRRPPRKIKAVNSEQWTYSEYRRLFAHGRALAEQQRDYVDLIAFLSRLAAEAVAEKEES